MKALAHLKDVYRFQMGVHVGVNFSPSDYENHLHQKSNFISELRKCSC